MGVSKSKPRHIPRLLEKKVVKGRDSADSTVAAARKTVQSARKAISRTEELVVRSRKIVGAAKGKAGEIRWIREKQREESNFWRRQHWLYRVSWKHYLKSSAQSGTRLIELADISLRPKKPAPKKRKAA